MILAKNLGKVFRIAHEREDTLAEKVLRLVKGRIEYETFWALKNINLDIKKGEFIGVIGENGAGKTTLLKLIAGILKPTTGTININGRVTSLLELGLGFHHDLTAKENVRLYGTIVGLSKKEINEKFNSIIEFAELERFVDTKLKNFSSGMAARLAFSTAVQVNPDVLLVDEVLAVGDIRFKEKCNEIFEKLKKDGKTIILVSHDLNAVRRFCDRTLLLKRGEQIAWDDTKKVIPLYLNELMKQDFVSETEKYMVTIKKLQQDRIARNETIKKLQQDRIARNQDIKSLLEIIRQLRNYKGDKLKPKRWGTGEIRIRNVGFYNKHGKVGKEFRSGDPIKIRIYYKPKKAIENPVFGFSIISRRYKTLCYGTNTTIKGMEIKKIDREGFIDLNIKKLNLGAGEYLLSLTIHDKLGNYYDYLDKKYKFTVAKTSRSSGIVEIGCKWDMPVLWENKKQDEK